MWKFKSERIMRLVLLFSGLFIVTSSTAQTAQQTRFIDSLRWHTKTDSLRKIYGIGKKIPAQYELSVLIALSYFPELKKSTIIFKSAQINTTLNARPTTLSVILRKKTKRKYIIRINTSERDSVVTFNQVPFNARIGLLGHEFNHFIDYRRRNAFQIINRLMDYTTPERKQKFEQEIDRMTIRRGLGWLLYDWSVFVLQKSNASKSYKRYKRHIYLEPQEIKAIIEHSVY